MLSCPQLGWVSSPFGVSYLSMGLAIWGKIMILLVLVPVESPTGTSKKFCSPFLKLARHQQQFGLRHGGKMRVCKCQVYWAT